MTLPTFGWERGNYQRQTLGGGSFVEDNDYDLKQGGRSDRMLVWRGLEVGTETAVTMNKKMEVLLGALAGWSRHEGLRTQK